VSSGALDRQRLSDVLASSIDGFEQLIQIERLSGGASQETYRLEIEQRTDGGETMHTLLCLRRAAGGLGEDTEESAVAPKSASPGLRTEALLMQAAHAAGIPEPQVYRILEPEDRLGAGFIMEWLEGETLGARIVRVPELAEVRPKLARQCGEVLGRLHQIDLDHTGLRDRLGVLSPETFLDQTWKRYKSLPTPQPMIDFVGRWLSENLPRSERRTLVHNDFRNGNVMVSRDGIVAVLDWEIAHIGDPMRDLGWMCCNSWRFGKTELPVGGFGTREEMFAGYEATSGLAIDTEHVKWWEVFGSFWWAIGCLGMAQHYRTGPDKSVERAAIGRRTSECQVDCVNLLIPGPVSVLEAETPNTTGDLDMPRLDELVESVRDFLRAEVMSETSGRTNFLVRVAANSLDVVYRDLLVGERHRAEEHRRLVALLGGTGSLSELRWQLVHGLRDGSIALDHKGLEQHLRTTVVNQIALDQPKYSGFKTARSAT
jgi:aminoglycoside phosphotransferase (APT) family kinase protein